MPQWLAPGAPRDCILQHSCLVALKGTDTDSFFSLNGCHRSKETTKSIEKLATTEEAELLPVSIDKPGQWVLLVQWPRHPVRHPLWGCPIGRGLHLVTRGGGLHWKKKTRRDCRFLCVHETWWPLCGPWWHFWSIHGRGLGHRNIVCYPKNTLS